ncbi:MAG: YlxR family protein [Acidimicrobiales bacterium]
MRPGSAVTTPPVRPLLLTRSRPSTEPIRTCVGCRRRGPASSLVRVGADGHRLVEGAGRAGRGAWLCRHTALECFDRVDARRWSRALRIEVDAASLGPLRARLAADAGAAPGR